ncbi:hypothetical protein D3C86_1462910 [compost metagenome]
MTPVDGWSPELLSVFLSRKLNLDNGSSFYNHIKVAPQNDEFLLELNPKTQEWLVSTATVVDGILKLITNNPKRDSNRLNSFAVKERKRTMLEVDNTPLREFYLENNDLFIYKTVVNYFNAIENEIFKNASSRSFIKKTVGIQALFFILKTILSRNLKTDKNISEHYFSDIVSHFKNIDFSDNFFTASGIGKSRIQNVILILLDYKNFNDIRSQGELPDYKRITGKN